MQLRRRAVVPSGSRCGAAQHHWVCARGYAALVQLLRSSSRSCIPESCHHGESEVCNVQSLGFLCVPSHRGASSADGASDITRNCGSDCIAPLFRTCPIVTQRRLVRCCGCAALPVHTLRKPSAVPTSEVSICACAARLVSQPKAASACRKCMPLSSLIRTDLTMARAGSWSPNTHQMLLHELCTSAGPSDACYSTCRSSS